MLTNLKLLLHLTLQVTMLEILKHLVTQKHSNVKNTTHQYRCLSKYRAKTYNNVSKCRINTCTARSSKCSTYLRNSMIPQYSKGTKDVWREKCPNKECTKNFDFVRHQRYLCKNIRITHMKIRL